MLEQTPSPEEIRNLIGTGRFAAWTSLCTRIDSLYDMERIWGNGGKAWQYEYKYRRGGKTLCALYAKKDCAGFMLIFGKAERERFESNRASYSSSIQKLYDDATTYHDGKWIMFPLEDAGKLEEYINMLAIKRKPNRKP